MQIGYARVSTQDQDPTAQVEALQAAGCERVYQEQASGGRWNRPQLERLLNQLRPGDVVHVWKLDRLGRSLKDLLRILDRVELAGSGFRSLTEAVDTTTPAGRMLMQMLDANQRRAVVQMVRSGERTPAEVARLLQVHPSTIGRIVAQAEAERTAAPEAVPCPGSVHRR